MASSSKRLINAYWIEVGMLREQQRIIDLFESRLCPTSGEHDWLDNETCSCQAYTIEEIIGLIRNVDRTFFERKEDSNV